jgi:hypothetical protein
MSVSELYLFDTIVSRVLRRHPRARRRDVEWFLEQSRGERYGVMEEQVKHYARAYRWNEDTIKAIRAGLHVMLQNGLVER